MTSGISPRLLTTNDEHHAWGRPPPGVRGHPMEQDRIDSLRSYGALDTPVDSAYDAVTALAAQLCGTPMAAVTLIDSHRQWFKSSLGLGLTETPRDVSFCSHAVADDEVLLVPDARTDPRFCDNPFVTGAPGIRGYLGVPLVGRDGLPVGALAVMDRRARRFTTTQVQAVTALSKQVVALLEQDRRDRVDGPLEPDGALEARAPGRLRRALEHGELVLFYQPIVDTRSGRPQQVEALLRWQHPELGTLPPSSFLPALEPTALVVPVGRFVLDAACAQAAELRRQRCTLPGGVAVNVAGGQLARVGLARDVLAALERHGLPGSQLTLELTEFTDLTDVDLARRELATVSALGVHVVVDDFGVGWSNLSRLLGLPVTGLKIDRGIAATVLEDPRAAVVVAATVGMAHALGLTVTAEGVESVEVRDHLRDAGCDLAQGWLYDAAVPAADLPGTLRRLGDAADAVDAADAADAADTARAGTVRSAHLDLTPEPASVSSGRAFLRTEVTGWDVPIAADQVDVMELLASELITNALVHARSPLVLTVELHPHGMRVAVRDRSAQHPVVHAHDETSLGGRGLALVEALAETWGVDQLSDGKDVWFFLRITDPP